MLALPAGERSTRDDARMPAGLALQAPREACEGGPASSWRRTICLLMATFAGIRSSSTDWQQQPVECGNSGSDAALLTEAGWTPLLLAAARRQPRCLQSLLHSLGAAATQLALQQRSPDEGKSALHLSAELGSAAQLSTVLVHVECDTRSAALAPAQLRVPKADTDDWQRDCATVGGICCVQRTQREIPYYTRRRDAVTRK